MVLETWSAIECGPEVLSRQDPHLDQFCQRTRLHRILETSGFCAVAQSSYRANPECGRLVGPGRLLRTHKDLRATRTSRHCETELPRYWTMESRRLVERRGK